jgi:hypothetical protein
MNESRKGGGLRTLAMKLSRYASSTYAYINAPITGLRPDQGGPRGAAGDERGSRAGAAAAFQADAPLPLGATDCQRVAWVSCYGPHAIMRQEVDLGPSPVPPRHRRTLPLEPRRPDGRPTGYDSACAAAGQLGLMSLYETLFATREVASSQVGPWSGGARVTCPRRV